MTPGEAIGQELAAKIDRDILALTEAMTPPPMTASQIVFVGTWAKEVERQFRVRSAIALACKR